MDSESLSNLVETVSNYLSGEQVGDLRARETLRQLIQRVFTPLSASEAALLRQAPAAHRTLLLGALSTALGNDPVARHLAAQLCAPEPAAAVPQAPAPPHNSGNFHADVRGNGNVVGHGNVIGAISVPPPAQKSGSEGRDDRAIRILFLSAAPDGMVSLRTDREVRDIQETLRQSEFRDRFDLIQEPAVRISDLQRCLLQHRPDIVHFSGHGYMGAILLEDRKGKMMPVPGRDLADLFSVLKARTRCIVLNTCYSAAEAAPLTEVIAAVIARPKTVRDSAAVLFSVYFYQALAFGRSVRAAFDLSCLQMRMEGWGDSADPILLASPFNPDEIRFAGITEKP
jgi:hypothetical protein